MDPKYSSTSEVILALPGVRRTFDLAPLPLDLNLGIVIVTLLWGLAQLVVWRSQLLERFLGIEASLGAR